MARYRGPRLKVCRALGVDLTAYPKIVACADAVAAASPAVAAFVAAGWK